MERNCKNRDLDEEGAEEDSLASNDSFSKQDSIRSNDSLSKLRNAVVRVSLNRSISRQVSGEDKFVALVKAAQWNRSLKKTYAVDVINIHRRDSMILEAVADDVFESRHQEESLDEEKPAVIKGEQLEVKESMLFRMSFAVAMQTFCSALVQTDAQGLLMEQFGKRYTKFASRQASMEKFADLLLVTVACALSDRFGRKPLLTVCGGMLGTVLNCFYFILPDHASPISLIAISILKLLHQSCLSVFLAVNGSSMSDACQGEIDKMAAANAAAQSYLGLSVVIAPQLAVQLRKVHHRAPFAVAAAIYAANWLQVYSRPETLATKDRTIYVSWGEALNPFGSATLLFRQAGIPRLRFLCIAFSCVSLTRSADTVLQAFTRQAMGWGRTESARLLSFWGISVFVGSQSLRKFLKKMGPRIAVRLGAPFLVAQEILKSMAFAWWSLPLALVVGLPSAGLEPALKSLIAKEAQQCTKLSSGAVQAALKTQQAFTLAILGSPLIGGLFYRWSHHIPRPWPAWHYLFCAGMALSGGLVHEMLPAAQKKQ